MNVDEVTRRLSVRITQEGTPDRSHAHYLPATQRDLSLPRGPLLDVRDETSHRNGLRIVCVLRDGADLEAAREWVLSTWPRTITVDARLAAPLTDLVTSWDAGDGSGLDALRGLVDA